MSIRNAVLFESWKRIEEDGPGESMMVADVVDGAMYVAGVAR